MNGRILVGLFLCSLFLVVGGDAQSPDIPFSGYMRADGEKPIWALEFIKVQPENFAVAMQYLDDHWMRVRAEAKRHRSEERRVGKECRSRPWTHQERTT